MRIKTKYNLRQKVDYVKDSFKKECKVQEFDIKVSHKGGYGGSWTNIEISYKLYNGDEITETQHIEDK